MWVLSKHPGHTYYVLRHTQNFATKALEMEMDQNSDQHPVVKLIVIYISFSSPNRKMQVILILTQLRFCCWYRIEFYCFETSWNIYIKPCIAVWKIPEFHMYQPQSGPWENMSSNQYQLVIDRENSLRDCWHLLRIYINLWTLTKKYSLLWDLWHPGG